MVLVQELVKKLDLRHRHVDDLLNGLAESVERLKETNLLGEIVLDGLLDAVVEERRVSGGVKVAVEVRGVVEHLDIAGGRGAPFDMGQ